MVSKFFFLVKWIKSYDKILKIRVLKIHILKILSSNFYPQFSHPQNFHPQFSRPQNLRPQFYNPQISRPQNSVLKMRHAKKMTFFGPDILGPREVTFP